MKLFGSSKKSKHAASASGGAEPVGSDAEKTGKEEEKAGPTKKKKIIIAVSAVVAALAAIALGVVIFVKTQIKPPTVVEIPNLPDLPSEETNDPNQTRPSDEPSGGDGPTEDNTPLTVDTQVPTNYTRKDGVYTFLALGTDKMSGSTDTIMIARLDVNDYTLNVVSIPRDTLVNVSWYVKKVNTLYNYLYSSKDDSDFLQAFANILGFRPDFYGIINLNAFIKLVDAVGGVDYEIPRNMNYDDPAQNLHIHFNKGLQHMNGQQAMEYMRYRAGYADADIGRIHAQQSFLTAAASQMLENKEDVPLTTVIDIFMNDVKTSLEVGECGWFAKELMKLEPGNIRFYTLPANYNDSVRGTSYVTIYVNDWLEMINEYLNPFNEDLTVRNLDILTRDSNRQLYATSGVRKGDASWGAYVPPATTPDPTEPPATDKPTEPSGSDEPTEPSGSGEPTEPSGSDEPTEPSGSDEPTEPFGSDEPTEPGDATDTPIPSEEDLPPEETVPPEGGSAQPEEETSDGGENA